MVSVLCKSQKSKVFFQQQNFFQEDKCTQSFAFSDPPGAPNITGIASDTVLIEDHVRRMTCISMAGNPLADLKWFRGDEELTNAVTVKGEDGDYSKSDLTITVSR